MLNSRQLLGLEGEDLAHRFLKKKGYKLLLKNYKCPAGELDVIAKHEKYLVFIEIKTRSSLRMGSPAEALHFHKKRQVVKVAKHYLKRFGIKNVPCRFDVVLVLMASQKTPLIQLIPNAFGEEG